jgi:hypothetical protein
VKIQINFDALWRNVRLMTDGKADFNYKTTIDKDFETDKTVLIRDIDLKDVHSSGGLLEVDGNQILLYIEEQYEPLPDVIKTPEIGKKYHVADCKALQRMRDQNRFERYSVTNNVSGIFSVWGKKTSNYGSAVIEGEAKLNVCKSCLEHLNYKGYKYKKKEVFKRFNLDEFFAHYSTLFKSFPKSISDKSGGYTDDWDQVSKVYRQQQEFKCEACKVDVSGQENLLHTHHKNGVKRDNVANNLQALCIDCHRKETSHQHMRVRSSEMHTINRLRREQALLDSGNWADALAFADTAYHGLLDLYYTNKITVPEIGYDVTDVSGAVIATAELAWPIDKKAVVHIESQADRLQHEGWQVQMLGDALQNANSAIW